MYQTKSQFKKGYQHNFNMIRNKKTQYSRDNKVKYFSLVWAYTENGRK
jgi:hypothetical protein